MITFIERERVAWSFYKKTITSLWSHSDIISFSIAITAVTVFVKGAID